LRKFQKNDSDPRIPPDLDVFPVSYCAKEFAVADIQKYANLAELLKNYNTEPIRGIDPSLYNVEVAEDADVNALIEAEKRARISEGHMSLRYVCAQRWE
jgi:pre-mRNA-splicing factor SPF27